MIRNAGLRLKAVLPLEGEPFFDRLLDGMPVKPAFDDDSLWVLVIEQAIKE